MCYFITDKYTIARKHRAKSYIQYGMKELKSGKVKSAFDFKIYTEDNVVSSTEGPGTNHLTTIPSTRQASYIERRHIKTIEPESKKYTSYFTNSEKDDFQDIVNTKADRLSPEFINPRIPVIDNTLSLRSHKHDKNIASNLEIEQTTEISDLLKNQENANTTFILLVTYLRSGSTFTADLIQQASNIFYLYEPLKPYIRGQHHFTMDSVCNIINGTCR